MHPKFKVTLELDLYDYITLVSDKSDTALMISHHPTACDYIGEKLRNLTSDRGDWYGLRLTPKQIDQLITNNALNMLAYAGMYDFEARDFTELAD